jgi:triosephosphate isomerase (TIM)
MSTRSRRMLIAGNWKMNPATGTDAAALAAELRELVVSVDGVDVVVCPPTVHLGHVRDALRGSAIGVGAQTMHWAESGAYTGETSPLMLTTPVGDPLATHVILGHSERRQYDGETDEAVGRKVAAAAAHGLVPIAAIGERLEERQAGEVESVIRRQLGAAVAGLESLEDTNLVVAYEPVWAIGTGMAATGSDAQAVTGLVRQLLADRFGPDAGAIPILYGGSVTADNAAEFFAQPDIDGALVGGASLRAGEFAAIVADAASAS